MRLRRTLHHEPKRDMNRPPPASPSLLEHYLHDEPFDTSGQVLLCCFGLNKAPSATRSAAQLRAALVEAGFRVTVIRHLIHTSPLLRRAPNGDYRLCGFDGSQAEH
jgi:hypothetical protein